MHHFVKHEWCGSDEIFLFGGIEHDGVCVTETWLSHSVCVCGGVRFVLWREHQPCVTVRVPDTICVWDELSVWTQERQRENKSVSNPVILIFSSKFYKNSQKNISVSRRLPFVLYVGRLAQQHTHTHTHTHTQVATQPIILRIELSGKPKWLPLNSGYHDVMRTVLIYTAAEQQKLHMHSWSHANSILLFLLT